MFRHEMPGAPVPVQLAGALAEGIADWAPVSGDQPMSQSICSHNGQVVVGIAYDPELVPGYQTIVDGFAAITLGPMAESMSVKRSATAVASFLAAQRYTRDEVFAEPSPVPAEAGAHGWWFRDIPGEIDVSGCEQRDGLTLLYVGVSPGPPRADGKPQVPQDLRKRVRYHFGAGKASAEGSTLRKSLGVLLGDQLGFALRRIGSGKRQTFAGGEAVLTQWMAENASVSWVLHPEPWFLEAKLLSALDLPLNIQDNERNAFAPQLKKLRRDAAVKAGKMRVLAEWSQSRARTFAALTLSLEGGHLRHAP